MKCLILFVALVAAAQAVPLPYGRHNIIINDDFWRIENPYGYSVSYHRPAVWTGIKNFEFLIHGPHVAPRTIFVNEKFGPEQSELLFKILKEYEGHVEPVVYEALLEKINHHVTEDFLSKMVYDLLWDLPKEYFYQKYFHNYFPESEHHGVYSPVYEKMGYYSHPFHYFSHNEYNTPYAFDKYPVGFEHEGQYPFQYQHYGQGPYHHAQYSPLTGYGYEDVHHYSAEYPKHYQTSHQYGYGFYPHMY